MFFSTAIATFALAASSAYAAVTPAMTLDERSAGRRLLTGKATWYGGNLQGGTCGFSNYTLPAGLQGAALSDSNWANAYNCGGCARVSHGGKSVTVMFVDQCPGCGTNHIDLFPHAFTSLAEAEKGIIDIDWQYVPCPVTGNLQIHMKTGVSEYWFSAQVVGAHRRTAKLEVSTDQGATWKAATRTFYNFFEISSGVRATSAWIRVTSHVGTQVVVKDVPQEGGAVKEASGNYA